MNVSKEKRGKFLQDWLNTLQTKKGMSRVSALEYIEKQMQDPIKLRIINAMASS